MQVFYLSRNILGILLSTNLEINTKKTNTKKTMSKTMFFKPLSSFFFSLFFILAFFHFFILETASGEESVTSQSVTLHLKNGIIRDIVRKQYEETPRVLSQHLEAYRDFFGSERHTVSELRRSEQQSRNFNIVPGIPYFPDPDLGQDIFSKQLRLRQELHEARRSATDLFSRIEKPQGELSLSDVIGTSLGISFERKLFKYLNLGASVDLSPFLPHLSNIDPLAHGYRTRQQLNVFTTVLSHQLIARKAFQARFPSFSFENRDVDVNLRELIVEDDGTVRFLDHEGQELEFNYKFLNAIGNSAEGQQMIHLMDDLMRSSFEELSTHYPEEAAFYKHLKDNEVLRGMMASLLQDQEGLRGDQGEIKTRMLELMQKVINIETEVEGNGAILVSLNEYFSPPPGSQAFEDRVNDYREALNRINEQLQDFSLSSEEREELEKDREDYQSKLKDLHFKQIQDESKRAQAYVNAGVDIVYVFARILGADQKVLNSIHDLGKQAAGAILIAASVAAITGGTGTLLLNAGGVAQGLNMLMGGPSEPNIASLLNQQTQILLKNQRALFMDLANRIDALANRSYDMELNLSTDIALLGVKVDDVKRYLYLLADALNSSVQDIRRDIERNRQSQLSIQSTIQRELQKIKEELYSIRTSQELLLHHQTIQAFLIEASGFRRLFNPEEAMNEGMIACSEDFNNCTGFEKQKMHEIQEAMGKLEGLHETINSNHFIFPVDLESMNGEEISSYFANKEVASRVENRINLLLPLAEWLQSQKTYINSGEEGSITSSYDINTDVLEELSYPQYLPLILDQYIALGLYIPYNTLELPQAPEGRTRFDTGIDKMCLGALKQKKASQLMREAIPLSWQIYRYYLGVFKRIYTDAVTSSKDSFKKEILGDLSLVDEGMDTTSSTGLDFSVESSLFAAEGSLPSSDLVVDDESTDSEGRKRIPNPVRVFLEDLLFLPEGKVKVFIENLEPTQMIRLAHALGVYVYEEVDKELPTNTCQRKEWRTERYDFSSADKNLIRSFWRPQSFKYKHSSVDIDYYSQQEFNCVSKGEGDHFIELDSSQFTQLESRKWYHYAFDVFPGLSIRKRERVKYSTVIHYRCKKTEGNFYDEFGNRYLGHSWDVSISDKTFYTNVNSSEETEAESFTSSEINVDLTECNFCSESNGEKCHTVDVLYGDAFRYYCGWPKSLRKQYCAEYKKGSLVTRVPVIYKEESSNEFQREISEGCQRELEAFQGESQEGLSERCQQEFQEKAQREEFQEKLVKKIEYLRAHYLLQFKERISSYFKGDSELVQRLSLAKLSVVTMVYGGFGRAFVHAPGRDSFSSLLRRIPAGHGSGMTLSKRFPEDIPFALNDTNFQAFKEWMSLMENDFHLPEELPFPKEDELILKGEEGEGRDLDLRPFVGLGKPSYVYDLLSIAARSRYLMPSETCLEGLGLSFEPDILETQFPYLEDSLDFSPQHRIELARYVGNELSHEMGGEKGAAILRVLSIDPDPSVREEVAKVAWKLEGNEGEFILNTLIDDEAFEVRRTVALSAIHLEEGRGEIFLEKLAKDEHEEVRAAVAEAAGKLGEEGLPLLEILSQDPHKRVKMAVASSLSHLYNLNLLDNQQRLTILQKLSSDEEEIRGRIIQIFISHEDLNLKLDAIRNAHKLSDEIGAAVLIPFSRDESPEVKMAVILAARKWGGEIGTSILNDLKEDRDSEVAKIALAAIKMGDNLNDGNLNDEESAIILLDYFGDNQNNYVRALVAQAVGNYLNHKMGPIILNRLANDHDPKVSKTALAEIKFRASGEENWRSITNKRRAISSNIVSLLVISDLKKENKLIILSLFVNDSDKWIRSGVVYALSRLDGPENVKVRILNHFLSDSSPYVRIGVAWAAGELGGPEGAKILNRLVSDSNPDVRIAVATAAGELGGPEGAKILNRLVSDSNPDVRIAVATAAGELGGPEGAKILNRLVSDSKPDVRINVAEAAGKLGGPEGAKILNRLVSDSNPDVRIAVATAAGELGDPEGAKILNRLVSDSNPDVRIAVAKAAGELGDPEGAKILNRLVSDSNPDVRIAVAKAAGELGDPEGAKILNRLVSDSNPDVRIAVAKAAGELGGPEGAKILNRLVSDSKPDVRIAVAKAAGELGGPEGIEMLNRLASDSNPDVREAVAEAAGNLGGPEGIEMLNRLASDSNPDVRKAVAWAAGKLGGPEGIEMLNRLVSDSNPDVRAAVAWAAGNLGGPEGAKILNRLASDENLFVKIAVAKAAGNLGDPEGIEILNRLASDEDSWVKRAVAEAKRKLDFESGRWIYYIQNVFD